MHAASHSATAAAAARECRRRESKCRTQRACDEATKDFVGHPNPPPWLNCHDEREANDPMISTE
jgi:hypothetical protein